MQNAIRVVGHDDFRWEKSGKKNPASRPPLTDDPIVRNPSAHVARDSIDQSPRQTTMKLGPN
jgi:hypothetical protein